ncbi:hypothetical protein NUU61_008475 [Penicillium alfredii]|uniref:Zn(2)-C6 fungal-type domain-containing protein n=1 Tax=Penicillium alfredii TaxID=1506179 RepID=A0A9W9JWF6_9EURO|nr:uncharacterized protein NUU61_008475 [Penicillium alfredii]KAJ5083896.1 hypothetical protein NUU61_008475 [Penicillium alfredii]
MPSLSGSVNGPKARTKTFTGCWTCRARRVKCDDEHPHCRRCRRSGWQCQGYGLRLGWSQTPGIRSNRRQLWSLTPQSRHGLSSAAVTALLAELDGCSGDGNPQQRGPFSVFSALPHSSPRGPSSLSPILDNTSESHDGEQTQGNSISHLAELSIGNLQHVNERFDRPDSAPLPCDIPLASVLDQDQGRTLECSDPVNQPDDHLVVIHSVADYSSPSAGDSVVAGRGEPGRRLSREQRRNNDGFIPKPMDPLHLPRQETELVHHWVIFLSGNMLLIDTPDNPCRTVFMPMALKGLEASPTEPNIHLSIFHAICASSAFSLFHLGHDPRYQSLAVHHDHLALRHLRQNLQRAQRMNECTLAAVLTCITVEAMSGRRSRWRTHVAGGLGLLENEIHDGWIRSPIASRLLQSYLSLSSLCSLPVSTQLMSLLNGPSDLRHYLERSHGITTPLVQFLAHITTLSDSRPEVPAGDLDKLELQLYLSFPSLSNPDAPGSVIIQHALNSFYYATIIYFRRTLRRVPLSDVQDLVDKAVAELEAADALTHEKGGCAYNWAIFVVAAECERQDLQARMRALFDRKSRHGIQNINVLCEIVQTLWHRRAVAGPHADVQWQEIAMKADFDIMLV